MSPSPQGHTVARRPHRVLPIFFLLLLAACHAPRAELWERWEAHREASTATIDHGAWAAFLATYVVRGENGVNLVRYGAVTAADRDALARYLERLQGVEISTYGRAEQLAYWINLYNATTVKVVLDRYPVASIKEIDGGPWEEKRLRVEGEPLSLNDVEHRILRPIWRDNRIHYAVNCASIGCPDLQQEPFTAATVEARLEAAATAYVNHPRGAHFDGDRLVVSSLYDWYQEDFGGSVEGVLAHLRRYATGELAERLAGYRGPLSYDYDWRLNGAP